MDKKFKLGQFYTTRANYIIGSILEKIPKDVDVIEPFCGQGDLLLVDNKFEIYDIDPKLQNCEKRDTLLDPPNYKGKFVITNPPFLARNKSSEKKIFDLYEVNDLYKASIKSMMECEGGILIVPLNLFCDEDDKFRESFLEKFEVKELNIFEETVFDDTAYTICSFFFEKICERKKLDERNIKCKFFPSQEEMEFTLSKRNGYKIGNDFFDIINKHTFDKKSVGRLQIGEAPTSNIFLRAIDTGARDGRVGLEIKEEHFFGKKNDRAFATISFNKEYSREEQELICSKFNGVLEKNRKDYRSMFMTNFRNSSSLYARKRISFDVAYKLINYIIKEEKL